MTTLREIDVMHDRRLQAKIVAWSFAVLGVTGVVLVAGMAADVWVDVLDLDVVAWFLTFVVASLVALPVHELVHAAFFRLFGGPGTRVIFGFEQFMLYAGSPGLVLPRGRFVWVLLAPSVLVGGALLVVPLFLGLPMLAVLLAGAHLSGCTGDWFMVRAALAEPGCTHMRDTDVGVDLLGA